MFRRLVVSLALVALVAVSLSFSLAPAPSGPLAGVGQTVPSEQTGGIDQYSVSAPRLDC